MIRIAFAISVAAVASIAACATTQALPVAPLPAEVMTDAANTVPVYYYRGRYYPYRWRHHNYRHRYYRYGRWRYY
jgi:hypothetical protein